MKKPIICILAAMLMLTAFVSALQSEPDAQGNVVCSGQYTTKYNPEKLNAIMKSISDASLVTEETELVRCLEDGRIRLDYRPASESGYFIEFSKIDGTVTANPATNKIEIADGSLFPLEAPEEEQQTVPVNLIYGSKITLQLVKDARQNAKPLFKVSKDGAVLMGDENIFFGCLKKDADERVLNCEISGQLYKEGYMVGHLTITGSGFVSEVEAGGMNIWSESADNIEELEEVTGLGSPEDFVAIPLTDLKEIKINKRGTTLDLQAKAQAETSAIDSLKIKSASEIRMLNFIENSRPKASHGDVGFIQIVAGDDIKITASPERLKEGLPLLAGIGAATEAKVSIFGSGSKLTELTDGNIYVFPESAEKAYYSINEDYATGFDSILLKPAAKEINIYSKVNELDIRLLPGYDTVTINPMLENDGPMQGSVKVTNPANGAWILYANDELTWTPGKNIQQLGFNFNINHIQLNPGTRDGNVMLSCTTDGICWLGDTMVVGLTPVGLTQEKLDEGIDNARRSAPARTAEEGAKGIGEGSEETLGEKCDTDEDCGATEQCDLRERVCVAQERRAQGAKNAEEIPPFGCEGDSDCRATEKCIDGECLVSCRNDLGCAPDFICRAGVCRMGCNADVDCFQGQRCIEKLCARQLQTLPPFSEDAKATGEEQKGIFARAWDGIKQAFGVSTKSAQETNACAAAGGRCRDICYSESEEASTSRSAIDACFLTPIADQPIETRRCCIPKEQERQNACEMIGGTCSQDSACGTTFWQVITGQDGYRVAISSLPEAHLACGAELYIIDDGHTGNTPIYRYASGNVCCLNEELCKHFDCEG